MRKRFEPFPPIKPITFRLPFLEFSQEVEDKCKRCIHYYDTLKFNKKFYNGHFCCHWDDICYFIENIMEGFCGHFRDRNSDHPYNKLRENSIYIDLDGTDIFSRMGYEETSND